MTRTLVAVVLLVALAALAACGCGLVATAAIAPGHEGAQAPTIVATSQAAITDPGTYAAAMTAETTPTEPGANAVNKTATGADTTADEEGAMSPRERLPDRYYLTNDSIIQDAQNLVATGPIRDDSDLTAGHHLQV